MKKIIFGILSLVIIVVDIRFIFNILLNKKYAVDELSDLKTSKALLGVQKIIELDYLYINYILLINAIWIVVLCIFLFAWISKR
jgi:hypothetical protein